MALHSFVDESKTPSYLLVAALIRPAHLSSIRKVFTALTLPGQRRIHFSQERDGRRTQIMNQLARLPIEAVIYASRTKDETVARRQCLTLLVRDHLSRNVQRLVLELDESHMESDRRLLHQEIHAADAHDRITYDHAQSFAEPLLTIADAVAWCWPKGGHWRARAKQLVSDVYQAEKSAKPGGPPSGGPARVHFQKLVPLADTG